MTPLAHSIARELTVLVKDRQEFWKLNSDRLRDTLVDTHFFECTEVLPLVQIVGKTSEEWFAERTFLPAPKTWIEFTPPMDERRAVLFEQQPNSPWYNATLFLRDAAIPIGRASSNGDFETDGGRIGVPLRFKDYNPNVLTQGHIALAHILLVIINSPHIIGRTTRTPHRGLERDLRSRYPVFGKYPLHAWSELKLEANITHRDEHTGEVTEAHLTGKKCLHFCRQHLRIRCGKLELVSAHWRGDPALGIKRTKYRVVPPKNWSAAHAQADN